MGPNQPKIESPFSSNSPEILEAVWTGGAFYYGIGCAKKTVNSCGVDVNAKEIASTPKLAKGD